MRAADRRFLAVAPVLLLAAASPAAARGGAVMVSIAAGPLDRALAGLAAQAGIDVGGSDPGLARVRVPVLRGRMTPAAALDRLLRDTPYRAERIDATTFRLRRRPVVAPPPRRAPAPQTSLSAPPSAPEPDIVVVASKTGTDRLRVPGAITVLDAGDRIGGDARYGLDDAVAAAPILQETALGSGRNKLFVRGVADSSVAGPTQSTTAVYWGDTPVAYTGADPGLNLYDVRRVEVLEGPQGTLYGAGAIGGVIRVVPRAPDLAGVAAGATAGVALTRGTSPGTDLAAMLNLPLARGTLGLRAVGYRVDESGYVDDVARGLRDVNGGRTLGGRLALRALPAPGWTLDAGLIGQRVCAADLQYAERGLAGLARASALAQPFRQDYLLAQALAERRFDGGAVWRTALGSAARDADSRFDATRARPVPIAYDTDERSRLLTAETRLSNGDSGGAGWLVGAAFTRATDRYARRVGRVDRQRDIVGTTNRITDLALFGQAGIAVDPTLVVTVGARLTRQRSVGRATATARATIIPGITSFRLDPTVGASWAFAPATALYARYQSGFRAGGVVVAPEMGRVATLSSDTLAVAEAGLRRERRGARGIAGQVGVSAARWRRVQADLVARAGFPFTVNLGDSRILGLEASGSWVPARGWSVSGALFADRTRLSSPGFPVQRLRAARLPNTPSLAASAGTRYGWRAGRDGDAELGIDWRYVGESSGGALAPFDLEQGGYDVVDVHAAWTRGRWSWRLGIDNLFDDAGDRFASANPFSVTFRDAYTPLRPRTLRIGVSVR